MAIVTGELYKGFTFGDVSSKDYGVYITQEAAYNAPDRDVEVVEIAGRNGAYILDKGRFKNITVSYKCGIALDSEHTFASAIRTFRNALASEAGKYVRLEDEYNPNEYRQAAFLGGIDVNMTDRRAGEFTVSFDTKPQRFLKSGETAVTIGGDVTNTKTETGSIVTIDGTGVDKVTSLVAQITPQQAGSGDPSPSNVREITGRTSATILSEPSLLMPSEANSETINGVTFTSYGNGMYRVQGTSTGLTSSRIFSIPPFVFPDSNEYKIYFNNTNRNSELILYFMNGSSVLEYWTCTNNRIIDLPNSAVSGKTCNGIRLYLKAGFTVDALIVPHVSKTAERTTTTVPLGQTVYGGTVDVVTGVLTVTHKVITLASYAGNMSYNTTYRGFRLPAGAITKPNASPDYISDRYKSVGAYTNLVNNSIAYIFGNEMIIRDERYTDVSTFIANEGDTQVCYKLATPQTYQLTAQQVELLTGNNNVWADTGDITLTYGRDPNKIVNPTLFDASPLLKVYGYGDIVLGDGGTVSVSEDVTVGNTVLANGGQVGLTYTESIVMGSDKFMTGDVITLASTSININLNTNESITSATASVSSGYSVNTSVTKLNNRTLLATVLWDEETLTVGTSRDLSTIVNVSIVTSGGNVVVQIPATISYNASTRTITRTLQTPTAISGTVSRIGGYSILGSITGYSTAPAYTEPLYFDLDIGEAYAIEDGVPVSINGAVSFGVDLPVLPTGASTITYDNTIDSLEIIPRWWEV